MTVGFFKMNTVMYMRSAFFLSMAEGVNSKKTFLKTQFPQKPLINISHYQNLTSEVKILVLSSEFQPKFELSHGYTYPKAT